MIWIQNKSRLGFLTGLVLTTFVTACVKNASKDTNPQEVDFKELQSNELTPTQVNGQDKILVREDSVVVPVRLTQVYQFTTHDIRDFAIQSTSHHNLNCRANGPFDFKITLVGQDGVKKALRGSRSSELLMPGSYNLQIEMENGGLCEKLALDITLKSIVRDDLVTTDQLTSGFICQDIEENGQLQLDSVVRVNTSSLQMVKYKKLNNGNTVPVKIMDDNTLCQIEKDEVIECEDSPLPTLKEVLPVVATQRNCHNPAQGHERGFAHLLVKKGDSLTRTDIDFTCRHKRNNLTVKMKNCETLFNLGENLPLQPGQTDIMLRRNFLRIGYEPIYNEIKDENIPNNLHVGLVKKVQEENEISYYEPVLTSAFTSISKDDFMEGQVSIGLPNIKQMVLSHNPKNLVVVFSRASDLRQGLYHIELSKLCEDSENTLVVSNPGGIKEPLCE